MKEFWKKVKTKVGKCKKCGGNLVIPVIWHGIYPPPPQCEICKDFKIDKTQQPPKIIWGKI